MPITPGAGVAPPTGATLREAVAKAQRRLVPFVLLLYVLAFLDRVNVGYAKDAFLRDTGLGEAVFAFGAGVFFIGYALFEVPSNLILHRVGARAWLCRIMVTWGLVSAAMVFSSSARSFYLLRFLLGVAEAGFFPGVIYYLTQWFPGRNRGPIMGLFYFGAPLAQIVGGPVSGLLLQCDGLAGLRGWHWLFLVEGLLATAAGVWTYFYLPSRPADAAWLSAPERQSLQAALEAEERAKPDHGATAVLVALRQPRVLYFGLVYALIQMSVYGVTFYLPSHIPRLLHTPTGFLVGSVSAIPWVAALVAAFAVPRLVGRGAGRRPVAAAALLASALGIAVSSAGSPLVSVAALCVATAGFIGVQPVFWTFPADELSGARAAGAIALINSLGALGGFVAPNLKEIAELAWSSAVAGQLALAATALLGAVLMLVLRERPRPRAA